MAPRATRQELILYIPYVIGALFEYNWRNERIAYGNHHERLF